jgi:hypothetical protein
MLTKYEFDLLFEIYRHKGKITFEQQSIFINKTSFYRAIKNLKEKQMLIANIIQDGIKRYCEYEITLKGITLYKILCE